MGLLKVDPADLQMVAATCDGRAGELRTARSPCAGGEWYQATSAAVGSVHEGIAAARDVLVGRMQSTAEKLLAASVGFSGTEGMSAAKIDELPMAL
jgi:hypothetical protein